FGGLTSEHTLVGGIYASRFAAPAAYVDTHSCAVVRMESEQNSSTLRHYFSLYVLCVSKTSSELIVRLRMLGTNRGVLEQGSGSYGLAARTRHRSNMRPAKQPRLIARENGGKPEP